MADAFRCIAALNKAAGKELTPDEAIEVFDRIQRTARDLAAGRIKPEDGANLSSPEGIMQHAANNRNLIRIAIACSAYIQIGVA